MNHSLSFLNWFWTKSKKIYTLEGILNWGWNTICKHSNELGDRKLQLCIGYCHKCLWNNQFTNAHTRTHLSFFIFAGHIQDGIFTHLVGINAVNYLYQWNELGQKLPEIDKVWRSYANVYELLLALVAYTKVYELSQRSP